MERSEILELMSALGLSGMRAAYDEIVTVGVKRKHSAESIIGALLKAEVAAKQARSINYQMTLAKLPLVKEIAEMQLEETPINVDLVAQLATGGFLETKRNIVLVGGTGTGKSHVAIGITRALIRTGKKARFFNLTIHQFLQTDQRAGRLHKLCRQVWMRRRPRLKNEVRLRAIFFGRASDAFFRREGLHARRPTCRSRRPSRAPAT